MLMLELKAVFEGGLVKTRPVKTAEGVKKLL
jgi:hypothetical protein